MPRNGEMSNEEKARAVLCRTGRPGNECAGLTEDEHAELAAVYEECIAPEVLLKSRVDAFWGARRERLEAAKASDDVGPDADLFRHSRQAMEGEG